TIFDRYVLALDIAGVFEALAKCTQTIRIRVRRCGEEDPDYRHRCLLRARRERPCRRRAAEQRDELAPPHSINSSASADRDDSQSWRVAFGCGKGSRRRHSPLSPGRATGASGGSVSAAPRSGTLVNSVARVGGAGSIARRNGRLDRLSGLDASATRETPGAI